MYAPSPGLADAASGRQPSICRYLNQLKLDPGPLCHSEYDLVSEPTDQVPLCLAAVSP
jgi:hypothetical protein